MICAKRQKIKNIEKSLDKREEVWYNNKADSRESEKKEAQKKRVSGNHEFLNKSSQLRAWQKRIKVI